jgi:hypothetical protein
MKTLVSITYEPYMIEFNYPTLTQAIIDVDIPSYSNNLKLIKDVKMLIAEELFLYHTGNTISEMIDPKDVRWRVDKLNIKITDWVKVPE